FPAKSSALVTGLGPPSVICVNVASGNLSPGWIGIELLLDPSSLLPSVDVAIEERVPELALRIVLAGECQEVGQPLVARAQHRRRHREELAPVRPGAEGGELLLDHRQQ